MEYLLLLLGVGSSSLEKSGERTYRTATYFRPDAPDAGSFETPFVGEAILDLYPGRFDRVHLFGTVDSMWDALYLHTLSGTPGREQTDRYFTLHDKINEGTLSEDADPLHWVEDRFSAHAGVETTCHLLPAGSRLDEFWEMFKTMVGLHARNGTVSLDITHGLRAQPIFLLLALFYLRSVHEDVRMGSVFYGALELARSYFDGKTPVYDLRPMVELMDWIEAARAFDRYGDAAPVAELLRAAARAGGEGASSLDKLAREAETVSQLLQVNVLTTLRTDMRRFDAALGAAGEPLMLDLIRPRLRSLPRDVKDAGHDWQALLRLARRHWDHYQAGLAVLTAYEAVVARMAEAYGCDTGNRLAHQMVGHAARDKSAALKEAVYQPGNIEFFPDNVDELALMRNGIAHVADDISPQQVYGRFSGILRFMEEHLGSPFLDQLPRHRELQRPS